MPMPKSCARDYGYDQLEPLDRDGIRALIGSAAFRGRRGRLGRGPCPPAELRLGLAQAAAAQAGVRIHENSVVTGIDAGRDSPWCRPRKAR